MNWDEPGRGENELEIQRIDKETHNVHRLRHGTGYPISQ
jgi:hypothetical protein